MKSKGLAALQLVSSSASTSPEPRHPEPRISEHHHFSTETAHTQTLEGPVMLSGTPRQYSQRYISVKYASSIFSSRYLSEVLHDSNKFPGRAYCSSKHRGSKVLFFETPQNDLSLRCFSSKHPERFFAKVLLYKTPKEVFC
uniref:Putative secreted protein n=1 Tax=Ixodes ricinus TaxID=34613 RepID=A0A6B0UTT9_IXORI